MESEKLTVYIIVEAGGEWEDRYRYNLIIYGNKEIAQSECDRMNAELQAEKDGHDAKIDMANDLYDKHCFICENMVCEDGEFCEYDIDVNYNIMDVHGYHLEEIELVL